MWLYYKQDTLQNKFKKKKKKKSNQIFFFNTGGGNQLNVIQVSKKNWIFSNLNKFFH